MLKGQSDWNEMTLDSNLKIFEDIKNTGKGKYKCK